jgi:hypothetical protein
MALVKSLATEGCCLPFVDLIYYLVDVYAVITRVFDCKVGDCDVLLPLHPRSEIMSEAEQRDPRYIGLEHSGQDLAPQLGILMKLCYMWHND